MLLKAKNVTLREREMSGLETNYHRISKKNPYLWFYCKAAKTF